MKRTGIVRKLDTLGRYVIPKEIRKQLNIVENQDYLEVFIENNCIVLKKHEATCAFCGSNENTKEFKELHVCSNCISELENLK